MKRAARLLAVAVVAALGAVAVAQAPALNVQMGLWEISSTTDLGGQMPAVDTGKMTPDQKARLEAAMKGLMGPHTSVNKSCVTKEKFNQSNFMGQDQPGAACQQAITTNTSTSLEGTVTCTGEHPMSGQIHIDAPSPTTFTGSVKATSTEGGRPTTVNIALSGKWLSADCGTVK